MPGQKVTRPGSPSASARRAGTSGLAAWPGRCHGSRTPAEALRQRLLARVLPGSGEAPAPREMELAAQVSALDAEAGLECASGCDLGPGRDLGGPGGADWWLALLPGPLVDEYAQATVPLTGPEVCKAGFWDRASGDGAGFAAGGVADRLPPGAVLAGLVGDAWAGGLGALADDELVGVLRAARRLSSWAAALELSAVSDLVRRRLEEEARGEAGAGEHASDEIAAALTLTGRAADRLADLAQSMDRLPATMRTLVLADIDLPRARVIAEETSGLTDLHAAHVEQAVIAAAAGQTTGQLRAATRRAVIAADPAAARTRKQRAERDARVERWDEPSGTGALAGRDLPPAHVLAADRNLTALARQLQAAGVPGTLDILRAHVFLDLLAGRTPGSSLPTASPTAGQGHPAGRPPAPGGPGSVPASPGHDTAQAAALPAAPCPGGPGLAGVVNLTMPLATWLGLGDSPGEVAGFGPLDAADSRMLAGLLARHSRTRWCLTLTDANGHSAAHGCARTSPPAADMGQPPGRGQPHTDEAGPLGCGPPACGPRACGPPGCGPPACGPWEPGPAGSGPPGSRARIAAWLAEITIEILEAGGCTHQRESPAYRPPPRLAHLIRIRQQDCSFPGCRRPAARCDLDHTVPYDRGGRTCECGLSPLCRRHHRAKQAHGWCLEQPQPGVLVWTPPSGRTYTTTPTSYPG